MAIIPVIEFMQDFASELKTSGNPLLPRVFSVLSQLMQHAHPSLLPSLYAGLQSFIRNFRAPLFRHTGYSKICETLSFEILRHANSPDPIIRYHPSSSHPSDSFLADPSRS